MERVLSTGVGSVAPTMFVPPTDGQINDEIEMTTPRVFERWARNAGRDVWRAG